ncbi:MAG: hypothetical protein AAFV97_04375 [Bacteroidota bacterium]
MHAFDWAVFTRGDSVRKLQWAHTYLKPFAPDKFGPDKVDQLIAVLPETKTKKEASYV